MNPGEIWKYEINQSSGIQKCIVQILYISSPERIENKTIHFLVLCSENSWRKGRIIVYNFYNHSLKKCWTKLSF